MGDRHQPILGIVKRFDVGEWQVHPSLNRLTRGAEEVRLEPKVMQVLEALAETPGEVVTREQLVARVWPDVFVSDDVLHRAIRELRKAFGDETAKPAYVETIRKRGYRLIAPVRSPQEAAVATTEVSEAAITETQPPPPVPIQQSNRFVAVASIVLAGVLSAVVFALASRPAPIETVIVFGSFCRDDLGSRSTRPIPRSALMARASPSRCGPHPARRARPTSTSRKGPAARLRD